jgi:hypothetical protein
MGCGNMGNGLESSPTSVSLNAAMQLQPLGISHTDSVDSS